MAGLDNLVQQLREEYKQAQLQVEKLREAISAVEGIAERNAFGSARNGVRARRTLSAAARRRIAQAQKARWARFRKGTQSASAPKKSGTGRSRVLSIAARRKIAAAQRARWARVRAQQGKKAA